MIKNQELLKQIGIENFQEYLQEKNVLKSNEHIKSVEVPGEGNMNLVLRITTNTNHTFIVKKAFDFVKKYPQVPAPINRLQKEKKFYEATEELTSYFPSIYFFDEKHQLMIQSDLGNMDDYAKVYNQIGISLAELNDIMGFLVKLHSIKQPNYFENTEMLKLNHEHIFTIPFLANNGLNLNDFTEGLEEAVKPLKEDAALLEKIEKLGGVYLGKGKYLQHGDFYPGSWMSAQDGLKIIDPEFCFFGSKEFDVAIYIAHLKMGKVSDKKIEESLQVYFKHHPLNQKLLYAFVGIEIMRRMMGVAQLPLTLTLQEKETLLLQAKNMVLAWI